MLENLPSLLPVHPISEEDPLGNLGTAEFVSREIALILNARI